MTNLKLTAGAWALMATTALAGNDAITLGMVLEPPNLDPTAGAAAAIDEVVYANIYEGLTRFGPDGAVLPGLASAWEVSEDGLTYTFTLREGVSFHDAPRWMPMTSSSRWIARGLKIRPTHRKRCSRISKA